MVKQNDKEIKARNIFGITEECIVSSFILRDGSVLDLRDESGKSNHRRIRSVYPDEYDAPEVTDQFNIDTDSIALHIVKEYRDAYTIELNVTSDLTKKQWEKLEECICYIDPDNEKSIDFRFKDNEFQTVQSTGIGSRSAKDCFDAIDEIKRRYREDKRRLT